MAEHFRHDHWSPPGPNNDTPSESDGMMDNAYVPGVEKYWIKWKAQGVALAKRYEVPPPDQDTELPHGLACVVPNALAGLLVPPGSL